jgi:hypothetical protein
VQDLHASGVRDLVELIKIARENCEHKYNLEDYYQLSLSVAVPRRLLVIVHLNNNLLTIITRLIIIAISICIIRIKTRLFCFLVLHLCIRGSASVQLLFTRLLVGCI